MRCNLGLTQCWQRRFHNVSLATIRGCWLHNLGLGCLIIRPFSWCGVSTAWATGSGLTLLLPAIMMRFLIVSNCKGCQVTSRRIC
ncbi:uncharacterized protein B0J16DRAFT_346586 [Fusarium flagelliforme]|uniref:uncharacterized protein n=1 Tax=Fusarium flagelliforme TaxID=2675880 RepID=UPI001E8DA951|nr:uncharacterized protein B0J16DRAFT_346586 [Fusarium flagelliforme]KAH7179279.1 hypothetical protein B0J16DRAFT_346586 [Fusarium flagelliforme]